MAASGRRRRGDRGEPDAAEKVRSGNVQAAGVIVGAAMKATRGKADAARVKDLILERLSS